MRFKKGSKEAKAFMAKIRAKKGKKTVTKKPATKKVVKKATPKNLHKDTKSHNVNIRVVSGTNDKNDPYVLMLIDATKKLKQYEGYLEYHKKLMTNKNLLVSQRKDEKRYYLYRKDAITKLKKLISEIKKNIK